MHEHFTSWLLDNSDLVKEFTAGDQVALFVHESVFNKIKQLSEFNYDGSYLDYELQINEKIFWMKLIYVTLESEEKLQFVRNFIKMSQYSFPWEDQPTIFCDVNFGDMIEKFIDLHDLNRTITQIDEKSGVTINDELIKTISFNTSEFNIIEDYGKFVAAHQTSMQQCFYINFAFPWLQPRDLKHFHIPIDINQFNTILPIILDHLSTIEYENQLNVFDLLNLKLALCDPLNPEPSYRLNNEIDYFLKRSMNQMSNKQTYIRDRHFDLHQYAFDHNFAPGDIFRLIPCFLYECQMFIESVEKFEKLVTEHISATIKLIDANDDVFDKLIEKSNIKYTVDGIGFDRMNAAFFSNLLAQKNVTKIILDTSHPFANFTETTHLSTELNSIVEVHLNGPNTFNFAEELVTSIKTIINLQNADKHLDMIFNGPISNYLVFDNFIARQLIFRNMEINFAMLHDLTSCTLKIQCIRFEKCTFENTCENWRLLNELQQLQHAIIHEDDGTWQCIFDFIANNLCTSETNQFQFNRWLTILSDSKQINLHRIKFTIDKLNSKLQFEDVYNDCQLIDLYDLKNRFWYDEKSDFEFYQ